MRREVIFQVCICGGGCTSASASCTAIKSISLRTGAELNLEVDSYILNYDIVMLALANSTLKYYYYYYY